MGVALLGRWHLVGRLLASCVVCAAAVGVVAARPAAAERSLCPGSRAVWSAGPWTMLGQPLGGLQGAAVDTEHPSTVYVTDGRRIERSTSGGCAWKQVLDLADRGASQNGLAAASITSLVVPSGSRDRVYATVDISPPFLTTSIEPVLASFDGGRSWQAATGLPPLRPSLLRASPADPNVMYLSMHTGQSLLSVIGSSVGDIWAFYASTDGGRSWTRRSAGQYRERFVADPVRPGVVWALGSETARFGGPYRSADGGVTWQTVGAQPGDSVENAYLDVVESKRGPASIVIAQGDGAQQGSPTSVYLSGDQGKTFRTLPNAGLDGRAASVAFGRTAADIVVSTQTGIYRYVSAGRQWRDVDSVNLAPLTDATLIPAARPSWWFWRPELVAVYREPAPLKAIHPHRIIAPPPVACPNSQEFSPAKLPRPPPASLQALNAPMALEPSIPSRANFRLSLPAVPTRLDTYFLLDTSVSMSSALDGVVCGLETLVDNLARAGVDARFGLGEFQDAYGLRYRRDVDIGPPGFDLQNALRTRTFAGGEEPHRGALYQTATGAGLRDATGNVLIPPHQEADYRVDTYRVVLMATDEPYQETTTYEPTLLQVLGALNARHIHHIGIHVLSAQDNPENRAHDNVLTVEQLREFSRGTGTFAPAGGVDCDGDGRPDLPAGAPLVCTVGRSGIEANLSRTLTALLLAVRQDGVVSLRPLQTDGLQVDLPAGQRIDVHGDHTGRNALSMSADVTCTSKLAGTRRTLTMAAVVSGIQVAQTPVPVTCGAVPPMAAIERRGLAAVAPPPAVAPAFVPAGQPALSSSVSSSVAANPGAAPVAVPGHAPGIAVGIAPGELEPGVEPTSHKFADAAAAARVAGASVIVGVFVVLERRRRSARHAVSTIRSRR